MPDNIAARFGALRAANAEHISAWRRSLLNGLCAASCYLGLLFGLPSVWYSAACGLWGLAAADLLGVVAVALLHMRRGIAYRYRATIFLAVVYLIAVALLFTLGAMTQIYLLAVPVLCTVLMGSRAATLALGACSATLFLAGYFGGIPHGLAAESGPPLLHWTILSTNFLLVASLLVVSCAFLLHGLEGALERQRAAHAKLESQLAALRQSMAAQKAAEESNEQKSEFLAMISHEVRTPLGGVIGMLRLAKKDASLSPDTRNKLRISLGNAEVLLHIINDILDFSRLEAGKMPFETIDFDLPALLNDVVVLLADRAETKGISLVAELPPDLPQWWQGDPVRLRQVVMNLVGNGVKFTEHGEVRLSAAVAPEGGILLQVRDSGIGIDGEAMQRLFRKFEQANSATARKYGGAGLGLAICKNIVDTLGGSIDVQSTPGAGSTFTVRLPLPAGQPALLPTAGSRTPHAASLSILCAEDGSTNQIILRELLADMGHSVVIAEDGVAALARLAEYDFDMVVMDSRMPRMDGIAALRHLRAGEYGVRNPAIPVIALTANAADDERRRFMAAGANGFLPKPIDEASLHAEIGRQIELLPRAGAPALAELDRMFGLAAASAPLYVPGAAARAAFLREGPRLLAAIRASLDAGDAAGVSLNAHSLLGGAGYFNAAALSALCSRIEKMADSGQTAAVAPLLEQLAAELDAAMAAMADAPAAEAA
ncbi:ATP-binding protein [Pseudoduganella sp. OTU4001]|uniref:ATP-binding protein n=1 Tax=Pseudoduganella sp. OTU4001 TaxID=3043854 RepID=UPI00313C4617